MKAVKRSNSYQQTSLSSSSRVEAPRAVAAPHRVVGAKKASAPTTLEIRGVPIHFPFKPYKCQEDYMGKVLDAIIRSENALLESPTGTGKTLCLLCAALAWQRQQVTRLNSDDFHETRQRGPLQIPTIIYASRTHSQLSQVVRELRNTRYRPKHAVLGSREQMCVHPKVKKANSTGAEINHDCNKLAMERKCRFRNKLEGFKKRGDEHGYQPVMDMEDLLTMGKEDSVCPFYYTRGLVEEAELILVPYNYLFDKDSRSTTLADVRWDNAVVIFDEAHNLESFASESASFDLTSLDIAGCVGEIQRAMAYMEMMGDQGERIKKENVIKLKSLFLHLEEYILNLDNKAAYRGEFMMEIFQKGASITHANHELFISEVRKLTDVFMEMKGGSNSRGAPSLDNFVQCVKRVFGEPTEARCIAKAQSYRVHVTPKNAPNGRNGNDTSGRTVSYWCFAPAEAMRELANLNVKSILVTSGTLSPLDSYALELDLPFPHRLENPHIIPSDQIHVRVLGKGVSGKLLTSSYERRQDEDYYMELGNTLVSLGKIVPGGMLIFFPSYGIMETCLEKWGGPIMGRNKFAQKKGSSFFAARRKKSTGPQRYSFPHVQSSFSVGGDASSPWKRLLGTKAVVVEPKGSADLPDAINEFHKHLNMPKSKGVALLGVCRGKISEGIDFAHDMCRAVVITGLPFAPSFDPKVKMKREFLDQNRAAQSFKAVDNAGFDSGKPKSVSLSGHEWYTQQAHRAVNQAVGRVIRNRLDYGAVLLLDSRFSLASNQAGLSKWVRPHILPDEGVGRAIGSLVKFYKHAASKAQSQQKEPPPPPPPNEVKLILQYEDEGKENQANDEETSKIAIVRREKRTALGGPGSGIIPSPDKTYVNPDRIVARLDMNEKEGAKKAAALFSEKPETEEDQQSPSTQPYSTQSHSTQPQTKASVTPTSLPVASLTPSVKVNANDTRESSVQVELKTPAPSVAPSKQSGVSPSQSIARQFFKHVQTRMSEKEQSIVKKSVVSMKKFQKESQKKSFLSAASDVINVVLNHDSFDGRSRQHMPELISLLFPLLPKHFRPDVQRRTARIVLQRSEFWKMVPSEVNAKLALPSCSFIQELWFGEKLNDNSSYLLKLKEIVEPISGFKLAALLSSLLQVIPMEKHKVTKAFFEQLEASQRISRIRGTEKEKCGEGSVDPNQFRRRTIQSQNLEQEVAKLPEDGNKESEAATRSAPDNTSNVNKRRNPYAKSVDSSAKKTNVLENATQERPQKMPRGASLKSLLANKSQPSTNGTDAVQRALQESSSGTYTGVSDSKVSSKLRSMAPSNFTCPICDVHSKKPMIAECGHLGCWDCWTKWLQKNKVCPVCRAGVSKETLAQAVFK